MVHQKVRLPSSTLKIDILFCTLEMHICYINTHFHFSRLSYTLPNLSPLELEFQVELLIIWESVEPQYGTLSPRRLGDTQESLLRGKVKIDILAYSLCKNIRSTLFQISVLTTSHALLIRHCNSDK